VGEAAGRRIVAWIDELPGFKVLKPIAIEAAYDNGETIYEIPELLEFAYSMSEAEAIPELKEAVADLANYLFSCPDDTLCLTPLKQKRYLEEHLVRE